MTRGSIYLTSLEKQVRDILEELDIEKHTQYPTHSGYILDFAIINGDKKIAIEVDGERWHSSEEAKKRDRFKDYQLKREGWKIVRVKEEEISKEFLSQIFEKLEIRNGYT